MKRVLLLAQYYYPSPTISALRPSSWAAGFRKNDIHVTVITRHWKGDEKTWEDCLKSDLNPICIKEEDDLKEYYLPFDNEKYMKIAREKGFLWKLLRKFLFLFDKYFRGKLSADTYAGGHYDKYVMKHLRENRYDAVLVTIHPLSLGKLAGRIHRKFGIPYFVDFRDLWNTDVHKKGYRMRPRDLVYIFYLRKWLKRSSVIFGVSDGLLSKLNFVKRVPKVEITNGYEKSIFKGVSKSSNDKLTISFIGTIYPGQNIHIFLAGIKEFLRRTPDPKLMVNFIGTTTNLEACNTIRENIPASYLIITDRISRKDALQLMKNSDILFSVAWAGYEGIYSGKIFEYLASGNNILIAPGDKDCIENLMTATKAGKIADTPEMVCELLMDWYAEWKEKGSLTYYGKQEVIDAYSREEQAVKMAAVINNCLK